MQSVYLLHYNNYYNRIVKKESTLAGYLLDAYLLDSFDNVNFVDNDGVNTTYVCNTDTNPDYIVVANGDVISSRWYVIEKSILRNGQFRFTLRRDVIVDAYEPTVSAPCFIEKATLQKNDPLIFNGEDMTVNQIKTSEYALKDETGCAWVVGYIPKDSFNGDEASRTVKGDVILDGGASADITVENLTDWDYNQYANGSKFKGAFNGPVGYAVYAYARVNPGEFTGMVGAAIYSDGSLPTYSNYFTIPGFTSPSKDTTGYNIGNTSGALYINDLIVADFRKNVWKGTSGFNGQLREITGNAYPSEENTFKNLNGKVIYESATGLYRRIKINSQKVENIQIIISPTSTPTLALMLYSNINKSISNGAWEIQCNPNENSYRAVYSYYEYAIEYEQIFTNATVVLSTPENRYHLEDQPFDMFCIPYSDDLQIYKNGVAYVKANKSIAVNMATQIGATTGTGNVYDVQLLPYCPVRYCILDDGTFDVKSAKHDVIKDSNGTALGVILWATTSAFTIDIQHEIVVTDPKIESQTDVYRLTSPNFNGQFEFNAAKNGGVESFNVDCNYKPFNPYIHVNPNFKLLYGQDFNDARGLICGGDFSLPQLSNAWANYQLENKNYQAIFDRQIQNMEVNNKVQRQKEIIGVAIGTVQGGMMGAASGMQYGPGAALAGGVGGTLASLGGGIADVYFNDQLRNEALDYTKDMYGYNLGNIQALPTSLTKTSAFTYNNKIFPILEYYTCTDQEKQALRDKIKYNGMTVMRIGTIEEFIPNAEKQYIKGRIIRLEGIEEDYHFLKAISEEIFKGAFFS